MAIEDFLKKTDRVEITFFNRFVISYHENKWIIYDGIFKCYHCNHEDVIVKFTKFESAYAQCKGMAERK